MLLKRIICVVCFLSAYTECGSLSIVNETPDVILLRYYHTRCGGYVQTYISEHARICLSNSNYIRGITYQIQQQRVPYEVTENKSRMKMGYLPKYPFTSDNVSLGGCVGAHELIKDQIKRIILHIYKHESGYAHTVEVT